jgi:hypothetical protein
MGETCGQERDMIFGGLGLPGTRGVTRRLRTQGMVYPIGIEVFSLDVFLHVLL